MLCEDEIPADILHVLGSTKSKRIDTLVLSAVTNSTGEEIRLDPEIQQAFDRLHDFMYESVYLNPRAKKEEKKVPGLIETLYRYLCRPDRLPEDMRRIAQEEGCERAACDYIAGMTDHFAVQLFSTIFIPKSWNLNSML